MDMVMETSKSNFLSHETPLGVDKVKRYGWKVIDKPGRQVELHKDSLLFAHEYQREVSDQKIAAITGAWSWMSAGVIIVALRDGKYWAVDGQHRVLAARRRKDITTLPCLLFETEDVRSEARGFYNLNTQRKGVAAVAKHRALVVAEDELAVYVTELCARLGIEIRGKTTRPKQTKCVALLTKFASEDKPALYETLVVAEAISTAGGVPIGERLIHGLWYIERNLEGGGLNNKRFRERLLKKDIGTLNAAIGRAAAFYAAGGAKIYAQGIVQEVNRGLVHKFALDDVAEEE